MRIRFLVGIFLFSGVFRSDVVSQDKVITDLAKAEIDVVLQMAGEDSETSFPLVLRITNTSAIEVAITDKSASKYFTIRPISPLPGEPSILFADVPWGILTAGQPDSDRISLKPGENLELNLDVEKLIWVDASSSLTKSHKRASPRGEMSLSFFLRPAGGLLDKDLLSVEGKPPKVFSSNSILIRF